MRTGKQSGGRRPQACQSVSRCERLVVVVLAIFVLVVPMACGRRAGCSDVRFRGRTRSESKDRAEGEEAPQNSNQGSDEGEGKDQDKNTGQLGPAGSQTPRSGEGETGTLGTGGSETAGAAGGGTSAGTAQDATTGDGQKGAGRAASGTGDSLPGHDPRGGASANATAETERARGAGKTDQSSGWLPGAGSAAAGAQGNVESSPPQRILFEGNWIEGAVEQKREEMLYRRCPSGKHV
jgi:hypothetical protein